MKGEIQEDINISTNLVLNASINSTINSKENIKGYLSRFKEQQIETNIAEKDSIKSNLSVIKQLKTNILEAELIEAVITNGVELKGAIAEQEDNWIRLSSIEDSYNIATGSEDGDPAFRLLELDDNDNLIEVTNRNWLEDGVGSLSHWKEGLKDYLIIGRTGINSHSLARLYENKLTIVATVNVAFTTSNIPNRSSTTFILNDTRYCALSGNYIIDLYKIEDEEFVFEDGYEEDDRRYLDMINWIEEDTAMIVATDRQTGGIDVLSWDGTILKHKHRLTLDTSCRGLDTWEEDGRRFIAVTAGQRPDLRVYEWDDTELTEIETDSTGSSGRDVKVWHENDRTILAYIHSGTPYFTLLEWDNDNSTLSTIDSHTLAYHGRSVDSEQFEDRRLIGAGHREEPYLTLLEWYLQQEEIIEVDTFELADICIAVNTFIGKKWITPLVPYATHYTDFSEYTLNEQPNDWTERWDADNSNWFMYDYGSDSEGSKTLRHESTEDGYRLITWDKVDNMNNVELTIRARSSNNQGTQLAVGCRLDENINGYLLQLRNENELRVIYYDDGSVTTLDSITYDWDTDTWYYLKLQVLDNKLKGKVWKEGEQEPVAWNIEVEDNTYNSGFIGIFNWKEYGIRDFDFIEVNEYL